MFTLLIPRRIASSCLHGYVFSETPQTFHYLESRATVPLKQEFKSNVKVLSRKPAPQMVARTDPTTGMEKLTIEDDDDDEDDQRNKNIMTLEERQAKAAKEREEKQRKYEEVRERLFGAGSGTSTPGDTTPPRSQDGKGKGKARAKAESRPQSAASMSGKGKQLYDPSYTPQQDSAAFQRRDTRSPNTESAEQQQIIRQPKGPDGSGRGGRGFASRGGKVA